MGNVFYYMLTKKWPFRNVSEEEAIERIRQGQRPNELTEAMQNSTHWANQALIQAMNWCWVHNATERPTARTIQKYLESQLQQAQMIDHATIQ